MTNKRNRSKVAIAKKQEVVGDIQQKVEKGDVSVPEACKAHGIEPYTYYNWKKRVDQLASRKDKVGLPRMGKPFVIRKMPIEQTPRAQTTPSFQSSHKYAVIVAKDANDLTGILNEIF